MLASNGCRLPAEPLLSRCRPVRLRALSRADLAGFARHEDARHGSGELSVVVITEALEHPATRARQLSLRAVIRMLDRVAGLEARPAPYSASLAETRSGALSPDGHFPEVFA